MKIKVMVLSCLVGAVVLFIGYGYSWADEKADKPHLKIGVVSVQKILQDCKRSAKYREDAFAEYNRAKAELDRLKAEVEAEKAGLKTLKEGSSDYLMAVKEILEKQAKLQAQQEFHKQQMAMKERIIIEELYRAILEKTSEIAKQKGLDLVFEKSEPELASTSASELSQTIRAHKVLYSGGCLDITDEVMARLDAEGSEK